MSVGRYDAAFRLFRRYQILCLLTFCQGDLTAITKSNELLEVKFFAWLHFQLQLSCVPVVGPLFKLAPCEQQLANVRLWVTTSVVSQSPHRHGKGSTCRSSFALIAMLYNTKLRLDRSQVLAEYKR